MKNYMLLKQLIKIIGKERIRNMNFINIDFSKINFRGADFSKADFRGADFSKADFRGADFSKADFRGADFSKADFSKADFRWADFRGADFRGADFRGADFRGADFIGADFSKADFSKADFIEADFSKADFIEADFSKAYFSKADFRGADFRGADFRGADFRGADFSILINVNTVGLELACPEEGSFIAYKKASGRIVKLLILEDAKRSSATTKKCRASKAKTLWIEGDLKEISSTRDSSFIYKVGEIIEVKDFDENRWNECSMGIHFFMNRKVAENYN